MTLEDVQDAVNAMWDDTERAGAYSFAYTELALRGALPHMRQNHATLHLAKATGKVAAALEPADHGNPIDPDGTLNDALADVVICALRIAGLCGRPLERALERRMREIAERSRPEDHA